MVLKRNVPCEEKKVEESFKTSQAKKKKSRSQTLYKGLRIATNNAAGTPKGSRISG
jgi:hypothetical protein